MMWGVSARKPSLIMKVKIPYTICQALRHYVITFWLKWLFCGAFKWQIMVTGRLITRAKTAECLWVQRPSEVNLQCEWKQTTALVVDFSVLWFNFQRIILCWVLVLIQLFAVIVSRSDLIGTRLIWPMHVIVYYYYYCYYFTSSSLLLSFFTFLNPSFTRESSISLPSTKLLRVIERRSALGLILSEACASSEWQAADLQCVAARQFGLDRDL